MNKIYLEISNLRNEYERYARKFTKDKNEIDEVIQELMLYFLQMNPETLKNIYEKDGEKGLIGYGNVVIKRSLTSPRSQYYYKLNKYYTKISSIYTTHTSADHENIKKALTDIPEPDVVQPAKYEKLEMIDKALEDMYWYDRKIFQLYYYENNTLDSLAEKTKISRNSLFTTINNVRERLKKIMNECQEE